MIQQCNRCGGIYATEQGESYAGQACLCNRSHQMTEADVRRIVREEVQFVLQMRGQSNTRG